MASIRIRHPELSDWLIRFSGSAGRSQFDRGAFLCRSQRVWDYHLSSGAIHASVEDTQNVFYDSEVEWPAADRPESDTWQLPDPDDLGFSCSCGRPAPCAHVCAVVIYRILELDTRLRTPRRVQTVALPDQDDAFFGTLLGKLRQTARVLPPAAERFNPDALKMRPDLQQKMTDLSDRVIQMMNFAIKGKREK